MPRLLGGDRSRAHVIAPQFWLGLSPIAPHHSQPQTSLVHEAIVGHGIASRHPASDRGRSHRKPTCILSQSSSVLLPIKLTAAL